jgi:arsenate reductase-like glutaredoxin family protein
MKATVFKTNLGETIKVSANYSKRHFTIKTDVCKFRTTPMTKEEFTSCLNNTGNDWRQFLLGCGDYYKI